MAKHYALVPAAGSGSRFGGPLPKQYCLIGGRPLLYHTLAALCACPDIERVWVVLSPEDDFWPNQEWQSLGPKLTPLFCGGPSRAASVGNGLEAVADCLAEEDWVLVHDAARPCLDGDALGRLIGELAQDPVGGLLAVPVADTLKRADGEQRVADTLPRDGLWQAQTPQMFRYGLLRRALAAHPGVTDEAGAVEALGLHPRLVRGELSNLKVTYGADLTLARAILEGRQA